MKILHVIDALGVGGGAEHSLASMLPLLRESGIESQVVTILPRRGGLQERLLSEGFDVRVLQSSSWPGRARELRALVRSARPDVVHATLLNSCLLSRVALAGLAPPLLNSLVNTSYDPIRLAEIGITPWKLRVIRSVDGWTARHLADGFHAITGAVRDEAVNVLGVRPELVTVVPRGRSREVLGCRSSERAGSTRQRLGIPSNVPIVLNVGRQDHQKAQAELVRAFVRVRSEVPEAILLIAGREGDASEDIRQAIQETRLDGAVRLLGHRTDVHDLFAASDVFAFPSLYEGLGCSLIEAMALGAPIVGSDAAAIAEVLDAGRLGLVVPRGDRTRLGEALAALLCDHERASALADAALEEFEERYELERVVAAMRRLYDQTATVQKRRGT
jgi:glycosyltransferase involved in cell wall biosynthesis